MPLRLILSWGVLILSLGTVTAGFAGDYTTSDGPINRIVADVGGNPVTEREMLFMASVSVGRTITCAENREACQAALERLIEHEIIWQEIEISDFMYIPSAGDTAMQDAIVDRAGGWNNLADILSSFSMGMTEWRRFVSRQEVIAAYVEDQFNPVVFVPPEEIEDFYKNEYLSLRTLGQEILPLSELEDEIIQILRQRKINQELVEWLERRKTELHVRYIER